MAVQFVRMLVDIWNAAVRSSRADIHFALGMIADVILEILNAPESELQIAIQQADSVSHIVEVARSATTRLNACQLIASSLLSAPPEQCFRELELPRSRSYDSLSRFIRKNTRVELEGRPHVYVVWNREPERFLYVGTGQCEGCSATNDRTVVLRRELLRSLRQGSMITLICPRHMSATHASEVEAALLSVLDSQRVFPEFNQRSQEAIHPPRPSLLDDVGQLVGELRARLQLQSSFAAEVIAPAAASTANASRRTHRAMRR